MYMIDVQYSSPSGVRPLFHNMDFACDHIWAPASPLFPFLPSLPFVSASNTHIIYALLLLECRWNAVWNVKPTKSQDWVGKAAKNPVF